MNVLKITLVSVVLLCIAVLSGCEEGYSRGQNMNQGQKVAYQPTGTGFWHPEP